MPHSPTKHVCLSRKVSGVGRRKHKFVGRSQRLFVYMFVLAHVTYEG